MAANKDGVKTELSHNTSSSEPKLMNSRVFMGNFPANAMTRQEVDELFKKHGKILGISLHTTYGFVQYENEEDAKAAVEAWDGKKLKGRVLDVNIATEKRNRKEENKAKQSEMKRSRDRDFPRRRHGSFDNERQSRWGPPRRSPSPGRFEHEMRMRFMELDRIRMAPMLRPPLPPPMIDPHFRHDIPMRDPYYRPRDDPYDGFREERLPPTVRDLPPRPFPREPPFRPREPLPPDWEDYGRPREERRPLPPPPPPRPASPPPRPQEDNRPPDMLIILVNKLQMDYAEHVKNRFLELRLRTEGLQLSPTMSLADALDQAAQRGLLYVVIISTQNEMHRSVTLTILHGRNPQEHKNMPLDDALGLVDRDYERYCLDVREGHIPARTARPAKVDVPSLLSKMASGEQLRPEQIDMVINTLQRQKEASVNEIHSPRQNTSMSRRPEATSASKESIESQQADLQAKILSLLGSSAVVPTVPNSQSRPPQRPARGGDFSQFSYPPRPTGGYARPGPGW